MTEDEIARLRQHLSSTPTRGDDIYIFSGFTAALRDSRRATGRNEDTGVPENRDLLPCWLGAAGYLILLDQIGTCFKPCGAGPLPCNSFKKALSYFTNLQPDDIDILWALRCTFAHDFSLVNEDPRSKMRTHHFVLTMSPNGPLVVRPRQPWAGSYQTRTRSNATSINVQALGDFVEKIVRDIQDMAARGSLEIILSDGIDELEDRYSVAFRPPADDEDMPTE